MDYCKQTLGTFLWWMSIKWESLAAGILEVMIWSSDCFYQPCLQGMVFDLEKGSTLYIDLAKSNSRSKRSRGTKWLVLTCVNFTVDSQDAWFNNLVWLVDFENQMKTDMAQIRELNYHPHFPLALWILVRKLWIHLLMVADTCSCTFKSFILDATIIDLLNPMLCYFDTIYHGHFKGTCSCKSSHCTCFALLDTSRCWQHSHAWNG